MLSSIPVDLGKVKKENIDKEILRLGMIAELDAVNLYKKLDFGKLRGRIKICKCPMDYDPSKIFETLGAKGIVKLLRGARHLTEKELD
jgi:hypothetical protein